MAGNYHWKIDSYTHEKGELPKARLFSIPVTCADGPGRFFGFIVTKTPATTKALTDLADELAGKGEVRQPAAGWFEKLLAAANRRFAGAVQSGEYRGDEMEELVALWGLQVRNGVSLARHGAAHAFLLQLKGRRVQCTDLFTDSAAPRPHVLFGEVISGALGTGDKIFFTGHELLNYLSLPHLQEVLAEEADPLPIVGEALADVDERTPITAALMHSVKIDRAVRVAAESPAASIENLLAKTKDTEAWLSPPLLSDVKGMMKGAAESMQKMMPKAKSTKPESPSVGAIHESPLPESKPIDAGKGMITRLSKLPSQMGGLPARLKTSFAAMPQQSRFVLIGIGAVVVLLLASIGWKMIADARENKAAAYTAQLSDVQKQRDDIEAALIYNDEDRAWKALDAARVAVAALPRKTSAQQQTVRDLEAQLELDAQKLRHVIRVTPETVSALGEVALPSPVALVLRENDAVAVDKVGLIVSFPRAGGPAAGGVVSIVPDRSYSAATADTASSVLLTNGTEVYTLSDATLTRFTTTAIADAPPTDVALWNRRLYVAEPAKNQLFRYSREGTGWGAKTGWVQTPNPDLGDVTAIAIDGAIWTAGSGGKVQKFESGIRQAFAPKRVEPAISALTDIWTGPQSENLYLFDAAGKRVIVLAKDTGMLRTQFTADWKNPTQFAVDEKNKTVYVLDGTTLTKFPLP
ncbi:hypothetical protein EPO33_01000 [Patescibacteria group bacterium]|nr:MAG: hypothetical protein EPO33_01000 [Patescibacteria group bacterium]